ncbi:hypothetical protein K3495_g5083 [Podosphaera aphanis]|nr:hypothetical protein K3495_g5083 [Podosphaera aphanis]
MPLRDIIKKETTSPTHPHPDDINTASNSREIIQKTKRLSTKLRLTSKSSKISPLNSPQSQTPKSSTFQKLSDRLHLRKIETSENVPTDLPEIEIIPSHRKSKDDGISSEWEKRATCLAKNEKMQSRSILSGVTSTHLGTESIMSSGVDSYVGDGLSSPRPTDDSIQEAIRLHESGHLEASTQMFGRLADPSGKNNALSQVLYGLSLRHGWGCTPNPVEAIKYLSAAASNAATIEELALQAGLKDGGAAKGELVLAIFELANCFRHGWGVQEDKVAAKQYYETAANLGDTDAMNEVARCYLEGFGCRKDKVLAARYYRLAEQKGSKTLGNSWIWKEKYDVERTAA